MNKWALGTVAAFILGGACRMRDDLSEFDCEQTVTNCQLQYSPFEGYHRACNTRCAEEFTAENRPSADPSRRRGRAGDAGEAPALNPAPATPAAAAARPGGDSLGAATPLEVTRFPAFDIPCERDNQCGPGKCVAGNCYYGCHSDEQCGSGDRCSQETGARVCQPDPNPPVQCTRTAQCNDGFECLNGACRQQCTSTAQCTNLLDRCGSGVCVPDRRPIAQCVLNSECGAGLVCLDGACVPACPDPSDAGVCLAEAPPVLGGAGGAGGTGAGAESSEATEGAEAEEPTETPEATGPAAPELAPESGLTPEDEGGEGDEAAGDAGLDPLRGVR